MAPDRPGTTGSEAQKAAAAPTSARPGAGGARGPKRPPRPDRAAEPAGAGNGSASPAAGAAKPATPRAKAKPKTKTNGVGRTRPSKQRAAAVAPAKGRTTETPATDATVVSRPSPAAPPVTFASRVDPPAADPTPLPSSKALPPGARRGRRVRRVVRRVELWSVLKLSLVLFTCLYAAVLATLWAVWGVAYASGQIENLQSFLGDVGLENYRFYGDQMFRACAAIGAVGVLAGTLITVLTAALVNVISEMTGGIRFVVIEEDVVPKR